MSTTIKNIIARQVYDSRATPTVEVDVVLSTGVVGRGTVPSGASKGQFEALELRDGDPALLGGKSVYKAIRNIESIIQPALIGKDIADLRGIDQILLELDGTENKINIGANALLGVSMACAWAGAVNEGVPLYRYLGGTRACQLPIPMIQIFGGGVHANGACDIQDYLVMPVGASSFTQAIEMVVNVYNAAKALFCELGKPISVADEGGFWPSFKSNEEGLSLLTESIARAGYTPGAEVAIALDVAASEFYNKETKKYHFELEDREFDSAEFCEYLVDMVEKYPIISIEDGMDENDWAGSRLLTEKLGAKIQLIGDDLFTTNINRIRQGVDEGIFNSVLIKMNQIGTISETLDAIDFTQKSGYWPVVSARSGETEDMTIAHLAIATNAGQLKVGSVARSERNAKWNEVIRIEEVLGADKYTSGNLYFPFCK
jgi:enolase